MVIMFLSVPQLPGSTAGRVRQPRQHPQGGDGAGSLGANPCSQDPQERTDPQSTESVS